ncbi:hypothetical protein OXYTRIMIC_709 [Oxytricha trifallax]|uniref:Uncharacterized protein n=1 Tax=Oxytricha trifallax TaxID=1172189 RepID=A0A073HXY9_9SPIT|nr:hypothetical protein OXYTRIMIC_709 [Oxytricha trifallax]
MQRHYMMLNLEVGHIKMEIGKSGTTIENKELERNTEKKCMALWEHIWQEPDTKMMNQQSHVDQWEELVQKDAQVFHIEEEGDKREGKFSKLGEDLTEFEWYLQKDRTKQLKSRTSFQESEKVVKEQNRVEASANFHKEEEGAENITKEVGSKKVQNIIKETVKGHNIHSKELH